MVESSEDERNDQLPLSPLPSRTRPRTLSDPLSPKDEDESSDPSSLPKRPPESPLLRPFPEAPSSNIQELTSTISRLYVEKNRIAVEMQQNLNVSESKRVAAESAAASFQVDALLWKQRATELEKMVSTLGTRLIKLEQASQEQNFIISDHQTRFEHHSLKKKSKQSLAKYVFIFSNFLLFTLGLVLLLLRLDLRRMLEDYVYSDLPSFV